MAAKATSEKKAPTLGELDDQKGGKKAARDKDADKGKDKEKGGRERVEAETKRGGRLSAVVVTCLFWLFLLGSALVLVMFDPTEDRFIRGSVLLFLDPEGEAFEYVYQTDLIELMDRTRELDDRELALDKREEELDDRESEIDSYAALVEAKEERADEVLEALRAFSGDGVQSVTERFDYVAKLLTKMTTPNAALTLEALYEADTALCVKICVMVGVSKLGPIMDAMEAEARDSLYFALLTEGVPDIEDLDEYMEEDEEDY